VQADTGLLAIVGSLCMMLALGLAWCLARAVHPGLSRSAFPILMPLHVRMARLSTNSRHRLVPYTHDALVTDRTAAEASTQAIRDVVYAARLATALKKP
jgi:hypothetical protein